MAEHAEQESIGKLSAYGSNDLTYLWQGHLGNENFSLTEVPSTLKISDEDQKRIDESWNAALLKNPASFDGTLWRYEGYTQKEGGVHFNVSPVAYSRHNVMRHAKGEPVSYYPNPFSINAIQHTTDGYLLIGVKGEKSDQVGLGMMGAGFSKRSLDKNGNNNPPENLMRTVERECMEETKYLVASPFDVEEFRALGVIFGSNHDTTVGVYVPLKAARNEVGIGNREHSDLWFLPDTKTALTRFLKDGGMHGAPAVDHALGCIELYLKERYETGNIK